MFPAVDMDDEIAEKVNDVDWFGVTESQASYVGSSLGLYHDSAYEHKLNEEIHSINAKRCVTIGIVLLSGVAFDVSRAALVVAVTVMLLSSLLLSFVYRRASARFMATQRQSLMNDLSMLSSSQPPLGEPIDVEIVE